VVLPKNAPVMARGGSARSVSAVQRPAAAAPVKRQAMNLTVSQSVN